MSRTSLSKEEISKVMSAMRKRRTDRNFGFNDINVARLAGERGRAKQKAIREAKKAEDDTATHQTS
jgi:hypothetical protein